MTSRLWGKRHECSGPFTQPVDSSPAFIGERDRFHTDASEELSASKRAEYERRQLALVAKREQKTRYEQGFKNLQKASDERAQHAFEVKKAVNPNKKNESSSGYNILTSDASDRVRQQDALAKEREANRAMYIYKTQNKMNPLTGETEPDWMKRRSEPRTTTKLPSIPSSPLAASR